MPRVIRYQYPGAVYHLMARGDGGKVVFENDENRKGFLFRLGAACGIMQEARVRIGWNPRKCYAHSNSPRTGA